MSQPPNDEEIRDSAVNNDSKQNIDRRDSLPPPQRPTAEASDLSNHSSASGGHNSARRESSAGRLQLFAQQQAMAPLSALVSAPEREAMANSGRRYDDASPTGRTENLHEHSFRRAFDVMAAVSAFTHAIDSNRTHAVDSNNAATSNESAPFSQLDQPFFSHNVDASTIQRLQNKNNNGDDDDDDQRQLHPQQNAVVVGSSNESKKPSSSSSSPTAGATARAGAVSSQDNTSSAFAPVLAFQEHNPLASPAIATAASRDRSFEDSSPLVADEANPSPPSKVTTTTTLITSADNNTCKNNNISDSKSKQTLPSLPPADSERKPDDRQNGAGEQSSSSSSCERCCGWCFCGGSDRNKYKGNSRKIPVCKSGISVEDDNAVVDEFGDNSIYTTKYSLKPWTLRFFLWKMLWEQFQRKANVYFLIIGGIQMIPGISPTGQFTTISTLALVILFSFLKNGVEDISRYKRDRETNCLPVSVLQAIPDAASATSVVVGSSSSSASFKVNQNHKYNKWHEVTYADIRVGDIVRIDNIADERGQKNNGIPCDMILLATSEDDGTCYVETANLDGETNLKMRKASDLSHIPRVVQVQLQSGGDDDEDGDEHEHEQQFGAESSSCSNDRHNSNSVRGEQVIVTYENFDELAIAVQDKYRGMKAECEHPNTNLYKFAGNLKHPDWAPEGISIENNQTLYRGCTLRKVQWAIGLCVFTGHETKVMRNANVTPHKASRVERQVNKLMLVVLALQAVLCIIGAVATHQLADSTDWYLALGSIENKALNTFLAFLTFVILTNNFIPISLYVSLEFIKFYQGRLMEQDLCMYYPPKDMPAVAKATDLNEELGQINFVFCDKTGTLTRNVMHFLKFGVGGEIYGLGTTEIGRAAAKRKGIPITDERPEKVINSNDPFWDPRMVDNRWVSLNNAEEIRQFFMALAICHTVVVDNDSYEAESPDEEALVRAARKFGYTLTHRASDHIIVETKNGSQHRVEILEVIHFSSDRKRMSVVCRLPQGDIVVYSKGAETTMFPRLRDGTDFDTAERIQNSFAEEGLRPLIVASKSLEPSFAKTWLANMKEARSMIGRDQEREELIADLAVEVECDLRLVGITGVEDKLQDQVPETILALRRAGVAVWMLTGDKRETAINIGFACDFLHKEMQIVEVFGFKKADEAELIGKLRDAASVPQETEVALVIDGHTLAIVLHKEENQQSFYQLARRCSSVICCRVSPKQKADVVELMRKYSDDSVTTLAIGDGANDVPMIQAAHVGVGISGMEGQQAANSADFAIGQFKYLHRLMLVHGRVNYSRLTLVINYFFYKNALLVMTQFWYCIFNLFTGQSLYEQWSLASWNVFFTSVPVIIVGILDRDILNTDKIHEYPQLYTRGLRNEALNFYVFTGWVLVAVYHSAVCFFGVFFGSSSPVGQLAGKNGIDLGLDGAGVTLYTVIIVVATVKFGFHIKSFTAYHWFALIGSIAVWLGFLVIYSSVRPSLSTTLYSILDNVGFILMPWLFALLMFLLCLVPDLIYKYGLFNFHMWCPGTLPLKAREAVMLLDAEDSIAAVRVPKELLRRRQQATRAGKRGGGGKGGEEAEEAAKEKLFKSAAEEATESLHTKQGWLLEFVDQGVEDAFRVFTFGELRRYKIGLGIAAIVSSLIVANFIVILSDIKEVELGGWALLCLSCWIGFIIVMCVPATTLRNFIHYVMCAILLVGFSGMSIANLSGAQRSPTTHPVTDGVILLGIIVLIRPPLVHAVMYVVMNTVLYVVWFQVFTVREWSTNQLLVRILELIIVAVTSLLALGATERFSRKFFVTQLQVKRAVKAVTREEERSMLLLQNVFPAAIVQEIREVKRPLADFSCTFHEASMLNSDIVKFTQFSSTKEPHVVVEMLNRMFTKFDAHAADLGLEKIKTIGDAYLCASGIPVPDPFHHRKIISMGRKMVHSMFEMNKEGLPSLPNLDVHIRVGAATGPIRAGVVGLQKACFDVFGEVSEDSEHMESSGIPDRLQVTEELYEAAKEFYQFEQLQNKDGTMGYFVIDDGIEPFMGLRAQVEEQSKQSGESRDGSSPPPPPSSSQSSKRQEGSGGGTSNTDGSSRITSRRVSRRASSLGLYNPNDNFLNVSSTVSSSSIAGSQQSNNSSSISNHNSNNNNKVRASPSFANQNVAEDGSPLEGSGVNSLLGGGADDYFIGGEDGNGSGSNHSNNNNVGEGDASDDAPRICPPRAHPLTNDEHLEDLYKFLEDTNAERQDLVKAYAGFDGDHSFYDLGFKFERAEEEFRLYYQRLAESRILLETVQGFLVFGICALLVGLHLGQIAQWFVIAQMVVSGIHIGLVVLYFVLRKLKRMEEDELRHKIVFNFENEDPAHVALGDAGALSLNRGTQSPVFAASFNPNASTLSTSPGSATSSPGRQKNRQLELQLQLQQQQRCNNNSSKNNSKSKSKGGIRSENAKQMMTVDDGLTQEDLQESDDDDEEEVDPTSPQFNISHLRSENSNADTEPPMCTWIRAFATASGLLSFSMPIILVTLVDNDEVEIVMVFVMLASVVYITSFLHMRFVIKVCVTLLHLAAVTGAFFTRVAYQRRIRTTEDGGNYLAVILCYVLCIIAGYQTESNVRSAFAVAKKVVFQNAELLSAIDLCDKLLKNVLPVSIVRRMIADPSKAIVDEVDEASVLFLYADGIRPHTEAEAEGKETGTMVNEMNEFLFILDCLCMYHHVEKIKTVPYLVVSGCPEPIARHCNRLAALTRDVLCFADAYNQKFGTNIRVKAGLHSGKVTAGVLGATKFIYDVFGDTVNFASRLASSSTWGVVQCSEHARKHLEGFSEVIDRGEIELKGKGMQKVYTLDLATIDLRIAPIVTQMVHAGKLDMDSFRDFDPHMKVFKNEFACGSQSVNSADGKRRVGFSGNVRNGFPLNSSSSSAVTVGNGSFVSPPPALVPISTNNSITRNPLAGSLSRQSTMISKNKDANFRKPGGSGNDFRNGDEVYDVDLDGEAETVVSQSSSPSLKRK